MRLLATLVAASLGTSLLIAAPAPAAEPAPAAPPVANLSVKLGITSFADLVVDDAHGHVYLSDGIGQVLVRDLSGAPVSAITGLDHPHGMTLSDDGTTLYVALRNATVLAVDTTALTTTTLPAGAGSCPLDVATTAGLLFVMNSCTAHIDHIDALDPATGTVTANVGTAAGNVVEASPALPDTLLVLETRSSPGRLTVGDVVTTPAPTVTTRATTTAVGSDSKDLAVSPDGQLIVTASGSPHKHLAFHTSDLTAAGSYDAVGYPNAVAFRADGLLAGGVSMPGGTDVYLSAADGSALRTYDFPGTRVGLLDRGLAFGATRLYAVTANTHTSTNYQLQIVTPRDASSATVRTDRTTYDYRQRATVRVGLDSAASAQRTVRVYATPRTGSPTLVGSGSVPVDGVLTVRTRVTRTTTFSVEYDGDAQTDPATASSKPVSVRARLKSRPYKQTGKSGKYYLWPVSKTAYIYAQVQPNHAGDCEYFQGQWLVNGHWGYDGTTKCVHLSKDSWAGVYVKGDPDLLPYPFRFRGIFRGDKDNRGAKSAWVYGRFVRGRTATAGMVELAGIEPASSSAEPGLLRVQSVAASSRPRRSH